MFLNYIDFYIALSICIHVPMYLSILLVVFTKKSIVLSMGRSGLQVEIVRNNVNALINPKLEQNRNVQMALETKTRHWCNHTLFV